MLVKEGKLKLTESVNSKSWGQQEHINPPFTSERGEAEPSPRCFDAELGLSRPQTTELQHTRRTECTQQQHFADAPMNSVAMVAPALILAEVAPIFFFFFSERRLSPPPPPPAPNTYESGLRLDKRQHRHASKVLNKTLYLPGSP